MFKIRESVLCESDHREKTVGFVIGPSTALYRYILKRCTLTNKAVGTTNVYNGPRPNLLRGDRALILVFCNCSSGLL